MFFAWLRYLMVYHAIFHAFDNLNPLVQGSRLWTTRRGSDARILHNTSSLGQPEPQVTSRCSECGFALSALLGNMPQPLEMDKTWGFHKDPLYNLKMGIRHGATWEMCTCFARWLHWNTYLAFFGHAGYQMPRRKHYTRVMYSTTIHSPQNHLATRCPSLKRRRSLGMTFSTLLMYHRFMDPLPTTIRPNLFELSRAHLTHNFESS